MVRGTLRLLVLSASAITFAVAQTTTGTLAGKVFTATKSGEEKPARLAHVYVAAGASQPALQRSVDKALTKYAEDIKEGGDTQQACLLASTSIYEAVRSDATIQTFNTGDDGAFNMGKVNAVDYAIVVMGTANGFQSVWYATATVPAGKKQKLQISKPVLECQ